MLQSISSVFVVYRCKTLTGSPDPTHANGMDKPCTPRADTPLGRPPRQTTPRQTSPGIHPPQADTLPRQTPPAVHAGIWSTSKRYASYWNAILLPSQSRLPQRNPGFVHKISVFSIHYIFTNREKISIYYMLASY